MFISIFPLWILNEVGESISSVFFILSIIGIVSALLNVFIGHITDLIGRRKLVIETGIILSALRAFLFCFFPYVGVIIGFSWITQIANGSLLFAILRDKIKSNGHITEQGIITSTVRTSISVGFIFGPWLGISLITLISFKMFFLIYGTAYLLLFLYVKFFLKDHSKIDNKSTKEKSKVVNRKNTLKILT